MNKHYQRKQMVPTYCVKDKIIVSSIGTCVYIVNNCSIHGNTWNIVLLLYYENKINYSTWAVNCNFVV